MRPKAPHSPPRAALAIAVSIALAAGIAHAADPNPVVISISGSTAIRNFLVGLPSNVGSGTTDSGLTMLGDGTSITLDGVTYGPYTTGLTYTSLAPLNASDLTPGSPTDLQVTYTENGSVEGVRDLANSWNGSGTLGPLGLSSYNPAPSNATPIWVNRNRFSQGSGVSQTINGFTVNSGGATTTSTPVQMAVSDVNTIQGFQVSGGTASPLLAQSSPGIYTPAQAGYGQGNTALPVAKQTQLQSPSIVTNIVNNPSLVGSLDFTANPLQVFDNHTLSVTATLFVANPGTGMSQLNRTDAQFLDTTGHLANGLGFNMTTRDNLSGTRNVAANDIGVDPSWAVGVNNGVSGVASTANALGNLDFSQKSTGGNLRTTVQVSRMAIGTLGNSDANNHTLSTNTNPLRALPYSDSTDGSSGYVEPSAVSISDGQYVIFQNETAVTLKTNLPGYGSVAGDSYGIVAANSTDSNNVAAFESNVLNSVANFPNLNSTDTPADQFLALGYLLPQMMLKEKAVNGVGNIVGNLPTDPRTNVNSPAYSTTQYTNGTLPTSPWTDAQGVLHDNSGPGKMENQGTLLDILLNSTNSSIQGYKNAFSNTSYANPNASVTTVTSGSSSTYGAGTATVGHATTITNTGGDNGSGVIESAGNYFFGNFNANYVRDLSSLTGAVNALTALEALAPGSTNATSYFDNVGGVLNNNTTSVTFNSAGATYLLNNGSAKTFSKGSLITMGDFTGDGKFDGEDLYLFAHQAAASDKSGANVGGVTTGFANGQITTNGGGTSEGNFGTRLTDYSANGVVLRKNAALDYLAANATTQEKNEALAAIGITTPTAVNQAAIYSKYDVNHDGVVNLYDAKIVQQMAGKNANSVADQTSAVITTSNVSGTGGLVGPDGNRQISLYDAIFTDGNTTVNADVSNPNSDLRMVQSQILGDFNLDGGLNGQDINNFILALSNPSAWAAQFTDVSAADAVLVGDFNHDGAFNGQDINGFIAALQAGHPLSAQQLAPLIALEPVPEPAAIAMLGIGTLALVARRRRRS